MTRTTARILVELAPMFLAVVLPFLRVLRGSRPDRSFLLCWGLIVFWFAVFSLVVPMMVCIFDKDLGHIVFDWVPDIPIIVGMTFFGWFYAGATVLLALLLRWVTQRSLRLLRRSC